jgi:hypothetical protein
MGRDSAEGRTGVAGGKERGRRAGKSGAMRSRAAGYDARRACVRALQGGDAEAGSRGGTVVS